MKMPAAIQNTGQKRLSIWRAKGPWGSNESSGAFSTFGWTKAHAERAIARTERPRRRRDRDRDLIGPHHTVPPGYDQSRPPDRFFGCERSPRPFFGWLPSISEPCEPKNGGTDGWRPKKP